jgi:hypothetical protein
MLTSWCLAVAFLTPWAVGAPLAWLLRGARPLRGPDWLWVPFVGLAALAVVLQNVVVFADVPLRVAAQWVWAAVAALWVPFVATASGRASLRAVPRRTLALSAGVYLVQSAGVLAYGVEQFRGNLVTDQLQYVMLARFLTDEPFSTGWADIGGRAWLVLPVALKGDRLGQSVLHGFFATTAGTDPLNLFFPTIALGAALLVPAVRMLAPTVGLFGRRAQAAAVAVALAPGGTSVLADCYLSHALFVPALVAFVAAVARVGRRPGAAVWAAVALALGLAVYTEFVPLMAGAGGVALALRWRSGVTSGRAVVRIAALLMVVAVANPAVLKTADAIATRGVGKAIDPNLTWLQIPAHVWLDRLRATANPSLPTLAARVAFVGGCFAVAVGGWCLAAGRARRFARLRPGVAATIALLLPPLALVPLDARYAVYKLLLTATPVFVLGLVLWARTRRRAAVVAAVIGVLAVVSVTQHVGRVSLANKAARDAWNGPDAAAIVAFLRAGPPTDVLIALGDAPDAPAIAIAVMYHGRHHRFRIASPPTMWVEPLARFPTPQLVAGNELPQPGAVLVADANSPLLANVGGEVVARTDRVVVVRVGPAGR